MKLFQFQILVALKKTGSLSKTARELYISQPSISMAIKELETELGYSILVRSNKGVKFTTRGEEVLKYAEDIMDSVYALLKTADTAQDTWETVKLVAPFHLSNTVLNARLQLENQYPNFSLWHEGNDDSDLVLTQLESGDIDIAVINTGFIDIRQFEEKKESGYYKVIDLYRDEICIIVREDHPLAAHWENVSLAQLLQFPYLTYRKSNLRCVQEIINQCNNPPETIHATDNVLIRRILVLSDAWSVITKKSLEECNSFYQQKYARLCVPELEGKVVSDCLVYTKNKLSEPEQLIISALTSNSYMHL